MNKLSTERAIEALYTVRAYYASLTAGYPKGKDCKGIDDVTCSEIANSCLMAIKALEQEPCEDCISRQAVIEVLNKMDRYVADELTLCDTERKFPKNEVFIVDDVYEEIVEQLPFVTHKTGHWIKIKPYPLQMHDYECSECGHETDDNTENYCSECGAKMFEPQESEG